MTKIKDKDYMNIGISLKTYEFSHMTHEKLGSKSTQNVHFHTIWGSENDKVKVEKVTKINLKIISKPCALLQTWEKTCANFQKDRFKIVWKVAITRYPLSIHLRSENDKVQKVQKSDKIYGKDYMKSTCTSSDYGENKCKVAKRLV